MAALTDEQRSAVLSDFESADIIVDDYLASIWRGNLHAYARTLMVKP